MRTIFILCGLMFAGGVIVAWRAIQMPSHYGTFSGAPTVGAAELIERPKDFLGRTVAVKGTVREQCKTMGCYFFIQSGTGTLRVELQEIAMTAPRREGRQARVEGQVVPYGDGYELAASAVQFE